MRVSHETIYKSMYVQSRGESAGSSTVSAYRTSATPLWGAWSGGPLGNMVMISERPAEVADRAVPGHWEGDLIFGKKKTAIGTLVERHTRYVISPRCR